MSDEQWDGCYERASVVRVTEVDGEIFVVPTGTRDIVYLNQTAAGLWRLLSTPQHRADVLAVFVRAFPDTEEAELAADIDDALTHLLARGVIRRRAP